jgi:hypothetical protein
MANTQYKILVGAQVPGLSSRTNGVSKMRERKRIPYDSVDSALNSSNKMVYTHERNVANRQMPRRVQKQKACLKYTQNTVRPPNVEMSWWILNLIYKHRIIYKNPSRILNTPVFQGFRQQRALD